MHTPAISILRVPPRFIRGFTMVEVLVVLLILGILTMAGLPSFRSFVVNQRVQNASFDLMSSLMLARSEAIKRNANVDVVPSSGSWLNGWATNAGTLNVDTRSALSGGISVTCYSGSSTTTPCPTITYTSNGRLTGAARPSIQLTATGGKTVRCISIDLSGRPNSKKANCP